jgi:hypothetical protein
MKTSALPGKLLRVVLAILGVAMVLNVFVCFGICIEPVRLHGGCNGINVFANCWK